MHEAFMGDKHADCRSWSPLRAQLDVVQRRLEAEEAHASEVEEAWERRCKTWHNELGDCSRRVHVHLARIEDRFGAQRGSDTESSQLGVSSVLFPRENSSSPLRHRSAPPVPGTTLPLLSMPKKVGSTLQDLTDDFETSTAEGIDMDGTSVGIGAGTGSRRSLAGGSTASRSSSPEVLSSFVNARHHHQHHQHHQHHHEPQARILRIQKSPIATQADEAEKALRDERQLLQPLLDALQRGDLGLVAHAGCSYASGTQRRSAAMELALQSAEERETKLNRMLLDAEAFGQNECEQVRASREIIMELTGKLASFEQGSAALECELVTSEEHAFSMERRLSDLHEASFALEEKLRDVQLEQDHSKKVQKLEMEYRAQRLLCAQYEDELSGHNEALSDHQVATKTAEQLAAKVALALDHVKEEGADFKMERDSARSALMEVESEYAVLQLQNGSILKESAERRTQEFRITEEQLQRSALSEMQALRSLQDSRIQAINAQLQRKSDEATALNLRLKDEQKIAEDAWDLDQRLREEQIAQESTISRLQRQLGEEAYALRDETAQARTSEAKWLANRVNLEAQRDSAQDEIRELLANQIELQSSLDRLARQRSTSQSMLRVVKEEEHGMAQREENEMQRVRCRFELEVLALQEERDAVVQKKPSVLGADIFESSSAKELRALREEVGEWRSRASEHARAYERAESALRAKDVGLFTLETEREAESRSPTRQRLSALEALLQTSETSHARDVNELRATALLRERRLNDENHALEMKIQRQVRFSLE